jgi:hypothetical protein
MACGNGKRRALAMDARQPHRVAAADIVSAFGSPGLLAFRARAEQRESRAVGRCVGTHSSKRGFGATDGPRGVLLIPA